MEEEGGRGGNVILFDQTKDPIYKQLQYGLLVGVVGGGGRGNVILLSCLIRPRILFITPLWSYFRWWRRWWWSWQCYPV